MLYKIDKEKSLTIQYNRVKKEEYFYEMVK